MKYTVIRNLVCMVLLVSNGCLAAMDTSALFAHSWTLKSLGSKTIDQSLYSDLKPNITFDASNRFYAFAGCNRIAGGFTLTPPDQLQFGNTLMTKMACMTPTNVEDEFVVMLSQVRFWQVESNQLFLLDANKTVLAIFN